MHLIFRSCFLGFRTLNLCSLVYHDDGDADDVDDDVDDDDVDDVDDYGG